MEDKLKNCLEMALINVNLMKEYNDPKNRKIWLKSIGIWTDKATELVNRLYEEETE